MTHGENVAISSPQSLRSVVERSLNLLVFGLFQTFRKHL